VGDLCEFLDSERDGIRRCHRLYYIDICIQMVVFLAGNVVLCRGVGDMSLVMSRHKTQVGNVPKLLPPNESWSCFRNKAGEAKRGQFIQPEGTSVGVLGTQRLCYF